MSKFDPMPAKAKQHIQQALADFAEQQNIRILLAVESGSRAWGCASPDSDYDVRFLYIRPQQDYLSIKPLKETLETPIVEDEALGVPFDLSGWDIRKALALGLKTNAGLLEWLQSPMRYIEAPDFVDPTLALLSKAADAQRLRYHYQGLGFNAWQHAQFRTEKRHLNRYCYALRSALALNWLVEEESLCPMHFDALLKAKNLTPDLVAACNSLVDLKSTQIEKAEAAPIEAVEAFLDKIYDTKIERSEKIEREGLLKQADQLFLNLLAQEDA